MTLSSFGSSPDSTLLKVIEYEGKKWALMDIELARQRAYLLDKGFEYYKLLKVSRDSVKVCDSIILMRDQQIENKVTQIMFMKMQLRNVEIKSSDNLELAKSWKKKARSPKGWIVPGLVGLILGYGLAR